MALVEPEGERRTNVVDEQATFTLFRWGKYERIETSVDRLERHLFLAVTGT